MKKRGISVEKAKEIRAAKGIEETKLQKARMKKGYSQKTLSVITGVSQRSIQCYEQRTREIDGIRLEALCSLCIALDCKIEDIIESEELIAKFKLVK